MSTSASATHVGTPTTVHDPAEVIREIYAAFARHDVPRFLARLAAEVEWEYGVTSTDVPWLQPRRGRNRVPSFLDTLASLLEIHRFEPKAFFTQGPLVLVLVDLEVTVKATGERIIEEDEVHIWQLDAQGHVSRFRHRADTHQHWLALHGRADPERSSGA